MLTTFETVVEVSGKGKTKQQALASALAGVQRALCNGENHVLVRIQPQNVVMVEAKELKRIERFLFFFLPRERKQYFTKLKVTVLVSVIETDKIVFETIMERSF